MTTRKHNEFLDADSSEDEAGSGYDSDAQDLKGGRGTVGISLRPAKRRKGSLEENNEKREEAEDDDDEEGDTSLVQSPLTTTDHSFQPTNSPDPITKKASSSSSSPTPKTKPLQPITSKSVASTNARLSRTGILYISRIPPYLTPHALRSFLEPHAPKGLSRIFLTPEPASNRRLRISNNGNRKPSFTDGWVEFVSKKDAKIAAELLNTRTFGGRGWWKDDVWNLRYLRGYKWSDLMEQIRAEEREREARLTVGIAKGRREERAFVKQVEQAKVEKTREGKKVKAGAGGEGAAAGKERERRTFRQNEVRVKQGKDKTSMEQPALVKRVLSKIF
jgi:ESF2/ABP1 family protein